MLVGTGCGNYPTVKPDVAAVVGNVVAQRVTAAFPLFVLQHGVDVVVIPTFFHGIQGVATPCKVNIGNALDEFVFAEVHFVTVQLLFLLFQNVGAQIYQLVVHRVYHLAHCKFGVRFAVVGAGSILHGESVKFAAFQQIEHRCRVTVTDTVFHVNSARKTVGKQIAASVVVEQQSPVCIVERFPVVNAEFFKIHLVVQHAQRSVHVGDKVVRHSHGFGAVAVGNLHGAEHFVDFFDETAVDVFAVVNVAVERICVDVLFGSAKVVEFTQQAVFQKFLNGVLAGAHYVHNAVAVENFGEHGFVGVEGNVGNLDVPACEVFVVFLEVVFVVVDVIRPVVHHKFVHVLGQGVATYGKQHNKCQHQSQQCHCVFFHLLRLLPLLFFDVDYQQQRQHHNEEDGEHRKPERFQTFQTCVFVDVGGKGFNARFAFVELGDDEVVQRDGERHCKAGNNTRREIGQHHFEQRFYGVCAKVQRRFVHVGVHFLQTWQNGQHHVGRAEGNVSDDKTCPALRENETESGKEHHQRNSHYYFTVYHGQLVYRQRDFFGTVAKVEDTYCGKCAQHRGNYACRRCQNQRVFQSGKQFFRLGSVENGNVRFQRKPVGKGKVAVVGKTEHDDYHNGKIQHRQHYCKIAVGKKLFPKCVFHSVLLTLSSLLTMFTKTLATITKASITRLITLPTPKFCATVNLVLILSPKR